MLCSDGPDANGRTGEAHRLLWLQLLHRCDCHHFQPSVLECGRKRLESVLRLLQFFFTFVVSYEICSFVFKFHPILFFPFFNLAFTTECVLHGDFLVFQMGCTFHDIPCLTIDSIFIASSRIPATILWLWTSYSPPLLFSFRIHIQRNHEIVHEDILISPKTSLQLWRICHNHVTSIWLGNAFHPVKTSCVWLFACKTTSKLPALVVAHNKPTILVCDHQFHKFSAIVHLICQLEASHWRKASEWSCVITGNYCLAGCAGV